jgi:DNA topoisomerase I
MLYEGWMYFYKPYVNVARTELIELHEGDILRNVAVTMDEKYTQPQPRFNQATLLEKMEKEKIGTKATRSEVISTLLPVQLRTVMGEVELEPRKLDLK